MMYRLTTYLYATSSFLEGVARLVDFTGSLNTYNCSDSTAQADFKAISSDWMVVGGDLRKAIKHSKQQERVILSDDLVIEARNQLIKDQTMQELLASHSK
jgi:hypothetical protein